MNKKILLISLFCLLLVIFTPSIIIAAGLVPCGTANHAACTLDDFFGMARSIYNLLIVQIAGPLALLSITVGGVMILISAGNANLASNGKKMLWGGIIGSILAFGSYALIKAFLKAIGSTIPI